MLKKPWLPQQLVRLLFPCSLQGNSFRLGWQVACM